MISLTVMTCKKRVFCCGNVAYDIVITKDTGKGGFFMEACPGGSVLNTSVLLSRLGLDVSLISSLSDDFLADNLMSFLNTEKISTRYVKRALRGKTALAIAHLDKKCDSSYIFYRDRTPSAALPGKNSLPVSFSGKGVFHTGSIFSYADASFKTVLSLMKTAGDRKMFTTYDPNWRGPRINNKKTARKRIMEFFELADLVRLSASDAFGITEKKTLSSALKKLPGKTVLTLGEKGSLFWDGKKKLACSALKIKVVDTIGAGDAFNAGLIARYCLLEDAMFREKMLDNLRFASKLAAAVCSSRGATSALEPRR
jgi:fructokinase